jgi:hypothetical protein
MSQLSDQHPAMATENLQNGAAAFFVEQGSP